MHTNLNYCHRCGDHLSTRRIEGRRRHWCQSCESPIYSNPKPCAGVFVVKEDRVLLIKRTRPPGVGTWSVPAGYLEVDEPPQVAAIRELNEETNVSASRTDLSLLDTQFVTHPDGTTVIVILYYVHTRTPAGLSRVVTTPLRLRSSHRQQLSQVRSQSNPDINRLR